VQVVLVLKKELMRTQSKELERSGEYRQVLVQCVHKCAVKYPDVASAVVHILMEFLGDSQSVLGALRECSE
jgi:coatomer subunit beta